jgi:hypothetical protein
MLLWRFFGWGLLVVAFVFTAAEAVAHGVVGEYGIMAASRVLDILAPEVLVSLKTLVAENIHPLAWDPLLVSLMKLPGWLLLGGPGVFLIWFFRDRSADAFETADDYPYTSYEDILAAAEEADRDDIGLPSKYRDLDDYDPNEHAVELPPEYLNNQTETDQFAAMGSPEESSEELPKELDVAAIMRNLKKPDNDDPGGSAKG